MTRVKICGFTRREDVEAAIQLGADAVGFVFEPTSPRFVGPQKSRALLSGLPPLVERVAVFGLFSQRMPFRLIRLVQATDFSLSFRPERRIQALRVQPGTSAREVMSITQDLIADSGCEALLLDGYTTRALGGAGEKIDWAVAAEVVAAFAKPVILAGGLTPENVAEAIKLVRPYAVDVSSGVESKPGIKDYEKMRHFIEAAKGA